MPHKAPVGRIRPAEEISCRIDMAGRSESPEGRPVGGEAALAPAMLARHTGSGLVEDEIVDVLMESFDERCASILSMLLGLDGGERKTLGEVAQALGLTQERVRQIRDAGFAHLRERLRDMPSLRSVMATIGAVVPAPATAVEGRLREARLTGGALGAYGLADLARRLPIRAADAETIESGMVAGVLYLGSRQEIAVARRIWAEARRDVSRFGYANLNALVARAADAHGVRFGKSAVLAILEASGAYEPLDDSGDFTLRPAARTRVAPRLRKILSVASDVRLDRVEAALRKDPALTAQPPSEAVLRALCDDLDFCCVSGDRIVATRELSREKSLSRIERSIVEIFEGDDWVMSIDELVREAARNGINRHTVRLYLAWSPVIERIGRGIYGLIGGPARSDKRRRLLHENRRTRTLLGWGRTFDGRIWTIHRVTEPTLRNGVVSLPVASRISRGSYGLVGGDDVELGSVSIGSSSVSGLRKLFTRAGVGPGASMALIIDSRSRIVRADFQGIGADSAVM
jgi:hypothetical protein